MASRHIDKLVREFISGSSSPYDKFDEFNDLQDPTFLTFKVDFFPDGGLSIPYDAFSSGGLFRKSISDGNSLSDYTFYDSAAEYLARIGAPARQLALQKFQDMLFAIQERAPWYFQSVSGLADFYKIEKSNNFRGKDKVLDFTCLESVDLRMSLLADLYRSVAFDFKNWREVLPINLRTFTMKIHVLEMRKFNTTYGIIADALAENSRPFKGEDRQKELQDAQEKRNVYGGATSTLFSGTFNNVGQVSNSINSALGGLFTNLGNNAGNDPNSALESAFEAISVQTFTLRDCEFDFFSEGPSYLDTVSVKDSEEASFKFKVTVGQIEKTGFYPFYDYIVSDWTKNTKTPSDISLASSGISQPSAPYFEEQAQKAPERAANGNKFTNYSEYRDSIFPSSKQSDAYTKAKQESDLLRKRPLENALGAIARNAVPQINQAINQAVGSATGGIFGTTPLGNVYEEPSLAQKAADSLNDFLTPGRQIPVPRQSVNNEPLRQDILATPSPQRRRASQTVNTLRAGILETPPSLEGKESLRKDILDKPRTNPELLGNVFVNRVNNDSTTI